MKAAPAPLQGEVWRIALDPVRGTEIRKTRPCLVVSPDEMNRPLGTVIVAPMTSASRGYPSRVALRFQDKSGQVAADQIRAVDKDRLVKKMGRVPAPVLSAVLAVLVEMFSQRRG